MKSPAIERWLLVVAFIALFISIRKCGDNSDLYSDSKNYLASLNDTIRYLKNGVAQKLAVEINKDLFISVVRERDDLRKALADAKLKAKNVRTLTQVVTKIETDTITIAFHDTLPCPDFIPVPFAVDSQYYDISGLVSKSNITITNVDFPDSTYIITAAKNHLFRKDEFLVSVKHTNPHIKTIGLQNFTIKEKRKWWQNGWLKFGMGLAGGIYFSQKILK